MTPCLPLTEVTLLGRVREMGQIGDQPGSSFTSLTVDTTASRFTGASIAGLVVGAMGVFVFAVALRHWLGERRAYEAPAEGAPSGSGLRQE